MWGWVAMRKKLDIAQVALLLALLVLAYFRLQEFNDFDYSAGLQNLFELQKTEVQLNEALLKTKLLSYDQNEFTVLSTRHYFQLAKARALPTHLKKQEKRSVLEKLNAYLLLRSQKTKLQKAYFKTDHTQMQNLELLRDIMAVPTEDALANLIAEYKLVYKQWSQDSHTYELATTVVSIPIILLILCVGYFHTKYTTEELETTVHLRTKELQESNAALDSFAHMVAHDLKSPAIKIKMYANFILDCEAEALPQVARNHLSHIININKKALKMVDHLLQYAKLSHMQPNFTKLNIADVITDVKNDALELAENSGTHISITGNAELDGDMSLLTQLFQNLIGNSIKYRKVNTKADIAIEISDTISKNGSSVSILVADNGIGVHENELEDIFKDFVRGSSVDTQEGTGVGLSTCKKIVDFHHGEIKATSRENGGLAIKIELPKTQRT